jgi:hypothetical protein
MMKVVAAFDEVGSGYLHCQLYLAHDFIIEFHVYKDIVCSCSKPIFDSNYAQFLGLFSAESLQLFVNM